MEDPFRSQRLLYRAIEFPKDEDFFMSLREDGVASILATDSLLVPSTRQDVAESMKTRKETSLIAVVICLPGPEPSSEPVPVGWMKLKSDGPDYRHHRRSEIGMGIAKPYRSQGYGGEAIRWILHWGFRRAGLHRIGIDVVEFNERAFSLYERLGFVREGTSRECVLHDGKWWGIIHLSMLEHEWKENMEPVKAS